MAVKPTGSDGPEALLASGIPDGQLHLLPVDVNCPSFEVHTATQSIPAGGALWTQSGSLGHDVPSGNPV